MSRTKDAIMDIIEWYGHIPQGYTFKDYNKDAEKKKQQRTDISRKGQKRDDVLNENNKERLR
jgi:hypothetical protein